MKKVNVLIAALAVIALCIQSCQVKDDSDMSFVDVEYADSTDMLSFSLSVRFPERVDSVAGNISDTLLGILQNDLRMIQSYEGNMLFDEYSGRPSESIQFLDYLSSKTFTSLDSLAQSDRKDALMLSVVAPNRWECHVAVDTVLVSERYAVFNIMESLYFGGAHGGISGNTGITFSRISGKRISPIVEPSRLADLQPILRKGMMDYLEKSSDNEDFSEENLDDILFIENGMIPLPVNDPYPSAEGLVFTYMQYEIAPYALGMPQFTVPVDSIRPFLTPQAAELF